MLKSWISQSPRLPVARGHCFCIGGYIREGIDRRISRALTPTPSRPISERSRSLEFEEPLSRTANSYVQYNTCVWLYVHREKKKRRAKRRYCEISSRWSLIIVLPSYRRQRTEVGRTTICAPLVIAPSYNYTRINLCRRNRPIDDIAESEVFTRVKSMVRCKLHIK